MRVWHIDGKSVSVKSLMKTCEPVLLIEGTDNRFTISSKEEVETKIVWENFFCFFEDCYEILWKG